MVEADATGLLLSGFGLRQWPGNSRTLKSGPRLEDGLPAHANANCWKPEAAERGQRGCCACSKTPGCRRLNLAALEESRPERCHPPTVGRTLRGHFVERLSTS